MKNKKAEETSEGLKRIIIILIWIIVFGIAFFGIKTFFSKVIG
jgi:flagellar basal body-associated protein FliL